eukprot:3359446-Amphidinium_carterae.2
MKAHLKQADVDSGKATADDFQGNQQADLLANQGTALHGPVEPHDFVMKKNNRGSSCLLILQYFPPLLQLERTPVCSEARYFLQCLDCNQQAGNVKATGKYNFAYMRTRDCRQLKTKKHKKRPTGFTSGTEEASSSGLPHAGETTGGLSESFSFGEHGAV